MKLFGQPNTKFLILPPTSICFISVKRTKFLMINTQITIININMKRKQLPQIIQWYSLFHINCIWWGKSKSFSSINDHKDKNRKKKSTTHYEFMLRSGTLYLTIFELLVKWIPCTQHCRTNNNIKKKKKRTLHYPSTEFYYQRKNTTYLDLSSILHNTHMWLA